VAPQVGFESIERNRGSLARYATARAVGMAALGGLAALGMTAFDAGPALASTSKERDSTPVVTTSATFTVALQIDMPKDYAVNLRSQGQADFAHRSVSLTIAVPAAGLHPNDLQHGAGASDQSLDLQAEWINDKAYVTVGSGLHAQAAGATEMSYHPSEAETDQIDTTLSQTAVAITYAKLLLDTLAGKEKQHHLGSRAMDGTTGTGTEINLTLAQVLKVIPGLSPAMDDDIATMGSAAIPVTVWVDPQGRLLEVSLAPGSKPSRGSISGTVIFSDLDAPVTITTPPAARVVPMTRREQALLRSEDPFASSSK
jgi:hypothetical protein